MFVSRSLMLMNDASCPTPCACRIDICRRQRFAFRLIATKPGYLGFHDKLQEFGCAVCIVAPESIACGADPAW